jgi:phosphoribosyl-ATP pyrophosphohydrolase
MSCACRARFRQAQLLSARSAGHESPVSTFTRLAAVPDAKSFDSLFAELSAKVAARDTNSSTVARVEAGVHEIGKKIVEEAAEVWMAAEFQSKDQAAVEISQLLYHIQVLMLALDLDLGDIYSSL